MNFSEKIKINYNNKTAEIADFNFLHHKSII